MTSGSIASNSDSRQKEKEKTTMPVELQGEEDLYL